MILFKKKTNLQISNFYKKKSYIKLYIFLTFNFYLNFFDIEMRNRFFLLSAILSSLIIENIDYAIKAFL